MSESKIIIALDYPDIKPALMLVDQLDPDLCRLKVGKELFTCCGPEIVTTVVDKGFDVFLDLKYHDIPNTVKGALKQAVGLGVWMCNVHALGGKAMLEAAHEAIQGAKPQPILLGVTVLTSLGNDA